MKEFDANGVKINTAGSLETAEVDKTVEEADVGLRQERINYGSFKVR